MSKLWTSHEQVMIKFWKSYEQVVNKLWRRGLQELLKLLELVVLWSIGARNYYYGWMGGWLTITLIIRLSQPSLAGVGAGAELGNNFWPDSKNVHPNLFRSLFLQNSI